MHSAGAWVVRRRPGQRLEGGIGCTCPQAGSGTATHGHDEPGASQFSICRPGTRLNSREFPEANTASRLIAWAATHRSFRQSFVHAPPDAHGFVRTPLPFRHRRARHLFRPAAPRHALSADANLSCDSRSAIHRDDHAGCNLRVVPFGESRRCRPARISHHIAYDICVEQVDHPKMSSPRGAGSSMSGTVSFSCSHCDRSPSNPPFSWAR